MGGLEEAVNNLSNRRLSLIEPSSLSFQVIHYEPLFEPSPETPALFFSNKKPRPLGKKKSHDAVASFYEGLTSAIYGATHVRTRIEFDSGSVGSPDILDARNYYARETKALGPSATLDIRDNQIGYLGEFQHKNPKYTVSYHAYRYIEPDKPLKSMSPSELLDFLTQRATAFSLTLPLSIIHHLYQLPPNTKECDRGSPVYRYQQRGDKWESRTRTNRGFIHSLASNPRGVIEEIGLDPHDYVVTFSRVSRPLFCHGVPVRSFPIVSVRDKSHKKWVRNFQEGYPENLIYSHTFEAEETNPSGFCDIPF